MHPFNYAKTTEQQTAIAAVTDNPQASYIAGGTDLLCLMKEGISTPISLVDINPLPLTGVEATDTGVRIGALARMSDVARDGTICDRYPAISQALLQSASPQLRNMATIGGNLMQRVRCPYFRDRGFPCNRREPDTGCAAIDGYNRTHAIFGGSDRCIAVHPSDLAVALTALDASICITGTNGDRRIALEEFYPLPGQTPHQETALERGELIVAIEVPKSPLAVRSHYLKVRDRASYEFALVSAAVGLDIENGTIRAARIALGGVAPKPWRCREAERSLQGQPALESSFIAAVEAAVAEAQPQRDNQFKIPLIKGVLIRALSTVGGEV